MGFLNWVQSNETEENFLGFILADKTKELYVKDLAIEHAVDLIARTISKSQIKVYRYDNKEKKVKEKIDDIYYRLNVRANPNEEGSSFFYRVISKLLKDQEALIVRSKPIGESVDYLYLADTFEQSKDIMNPKKYSQVTLTDLKGNSLPLDKIFDGEDVIHLTLGNSQIKKVIDDFYTDYGILLKIASKSYKSSNTKKWRLKLPGGQPAMIDPVTKEQITYEDYKKKIGKGLFDDEEAIVMLSEQFGLELLNEGDGKTSEDYRKMIREICELIAMAFGIPLDVFFGSKTDKSTGTNDFITFAVAPVLEILEDGFNAKLIEKKDYLKGERIMIDKFSMKHFDIMDVASSLDKLTGIGFSFNQLCGFMGLPIIDEDWANNHNLTKNYSNVKGGD
jgi:HK97 family phage portal protein